MKTYVLTISNTFPKTHKKSGLETNFVGKINSLLKKHTIRGNFLLWQKRFEKIEKGEACLSIRNWAGKPYNSKQVEVFNLKNTDGISLEKLEFHKDKDGVPALKYPLINNKFEPNIDTIAENDGLSLLDFREWFKGYDLSQPMAIIHFTHFTYSDKQKPLLFDSLIHEDESLHSLKKEIVKLKMFLIKLNDIPLIEQDADHNDALSYANKIIKKKIKKLKNKVLHER